MDPSMSSMSKCSLTKMMATSTVIKRDLDLTPKGVYLMRKLLLSTTGLLAGAMLALGTANAGEISTDVAEAKKQSQVVLDWLDGKLDNYGNNKVTYDGPVIELRSSSHVPPVSFLAKLQIDGWKQLEKMSNGKIKVSTTWAQTVHKANKGREAVRTGLSDHAPCFSLYTARDYQMTPALGLPFMFNNSHEATASAEHLYPKYLKQEFEKQKVLIMREAHTSPYNLYNNKPVKTLEEIQGMKIRAGGGIHARIIQELGAVQVNMPAPDIYPSVQRGTLDAVHFNDAAAETFRLSEVTKYLTFNGFNVLTVEYCLSKEFFDALPADLQVVVNNWGRQMAIAEAVGFYDYGGMVAIDNMRQKNGLQLVKMPKAELDRWAEKLKGVEAEWIAETAKLGLPAAEFVADIKKMGKKYAAMSANDIMIDAIKNPVQGMYDMKK
jgi:TRAP-type C4-dicarboxylate transport system substrate-binding protein